MARTNADIIRAIGKWQAAGYVHPMTCRDEDCRAILDPVEFDGAIALECPACRKMQLKIPLFLLHPDLEKRLDALKAKIEAMKDAQKKDGP